MVFRKDQLEASLHEEKKLIEDGRLKEDNPLDVSESFTKFCEACRRGDLKSCQERITEGVNINARDRFDYTPLILASLCGHYEVVQLLLESGALCERDTFQGERCLYNALNDRIRNLLLSYEYSKSSDPLQPFASHITSLLIRDAPRTFDILVTAGREVFHLHKFILSARSPYFSRKLSTASDTASWKLPSAIPPQAFAVAIRYIYLGEIPREVGGGYGTGYSEDEILEGLDKITKQLEIRTLWDGILEGSDRRLVRQRRSEEVQKGREQLENWFRARILGHKIVVDTARVASVKWDRNNAIFADVLLRADDPIDDTRTRGFDNADIPVRKTKDPLNGIPVGPSAQTAQLQSGTSTLFPVHRAMLLRSDFFLTMFASEFREAQESEYLQIIPIECAPDVLEVVLTFLYTDKADFNLDLATEVLFAADLLLIERLKLKAAVIISTLGNGPIAQSTSPGNDPSTPPEEEPIDIYDVIRAGWLTRVPRLEEFGARYLAYRLETHIDQEEFADLIRESAARIRGRQETDSIEILDDIRYYLSERFPLRFEDSGLEDMMDETPESGPDPGFAHVASIDPYPDLEDEGIDVAFTENGHPSTLAAKDTTATEATSQLDSGAIRTLDGDIAGDEFSSDAINYQVLLGKIDSLLENLKLDA